MGPDECKPVLGGHLRYRFDSIGKCREATRCARWLSALIEVGGADHSGRPDRRGG